MLDYDFIFASFSVDAVRESLILSHTWEKRKMLLNERLHKQGEKWKSDLIRITGWAEIVYSFPLSDLFKDVGKIIAVLSLDV